MLQDRSVCPTYMYSTQAEQLVASSAPSSIWLQNAAQLHWPPEQGCTERCSLQTAWAGAPSQQGQPASQPSSLQWSISLSQEFRLSLLLPNLAREIDVPRYWNHNCVTWHGFRVWRREYTLQLVLPNINFYGLLSPCSSCSQQFPIREEVIYLFWI